jgi:hypothetical protein
MLFFLSFFLSCCLCGGVKVGFSFVKERGFVGMNTVTKMGMNTVTKFCFISLQLFFLVALSFLVNFRIYVTIGYLLLRFLYLIVMLVVFF